MVVYGRVFVSWGPPKMVGPPKMMAFYSFPFKTRTTGTLNKSTPMLALRYNLGTTRWPRVLSRALAARSGSACFNCLGRRALRRSLPGKEAQARQLAKADKGAMGTRSSEEQGMCVPTLPKWHCCVEYGPTVSNHANMRCHRIFVR